MFQFSLHVYIKILKSLKTYVYFIINILFTSYYFISEYLSSRDISKLNIGTDALLFRDYKIISTFGESVYFITLGILLWMLILLEIMKYFRTNNDQGILLTHIVKPVKRTTYFFSVIIGIYLAFLTVSILNIFISYLLAIIVFKFTNAALLSMLLVAIIYAFIHIAIIIIILSFIAVVIKQTEISIIVSVIVVLLASTSIFLKQSIIDMDIQNMLIFNIMLFIANTDSYIYMYLTRNIFIIFNELLAASTNTPIEFFDTFQLVSIYSTDPDLDFIIYEKSFNDRLISKIILFTTLIVNSVFLFLTNIFFSKMDIT